MANFKWTKEQLKAITQKNCDLLVAAAAGAGKTAVLVERIIRKITDSENPVDIDRILVVTFTNAAAAEMRQRIGDAIVKLLNSDKNQENLRRQLTLLTRANITTIHSFCLDVIRNNFHQLDIDPGFRIADETETTLIKLEALEELLEDKYESSDNQNFLRLLECFGGNIDDRKLADIILELYEFVRSYPWPFDWLHEYSEALNLDEDIDFSRTKWAKSLLTTLKIEISGMVDTLKRAKKICIDYELTPYLSNLEQDIAVVRHILNSTESSWDNLANVFSTAEFERLSRCGKDADKDAQENVKSLRNQVKEKLKTLKDEIFNMTSIQISSTLKTLYPLIKCLSLTVMEFEQRYSNKKKDKSLLDFGDLEHYCLKILTTREGSCIKPSLAALHYRERFLEILVDEYQDSNSVQEFILNMISDIENHPHVFMVGDVKQSIYRFRQAKPELFLQKYNSYPSEPGDKCMKILLHKNYRSRGEIISGVNYIFKQIMSCSIGELDYNDAEALYKGRDFLEDTGAVCDHCVEVHVINGSQSVLCHNDDNSFDSSNDCLTGNGSSPIPTRHSLDIEHEPYSKSAENDDESSENNDYDELPDRVEAEAEVVASRILELVAGKDPFRVWDSNSKEYRDAQYKDIVILLRATKNWADTFTEVLSSRNIPVYADTGTGFFKTIEIETFISLLQIIDNPIQDIPLIAVLRSQIGDFTPDDLIEIRSADKNSSFYTAMNKFLQERDEDALYTKILEFLNRLDGWRKKSLLLSTDELIWHLYNDTGYYSYVALMPGGRQRQSNLEILLDRARQYEKTSYSGLFNFINFIDRLKSRQGDMGSAKILGENENVVRIMSIHKSKGLEFPIVFVSGCGKRFNMQDTTKSILLHQELGFGPDFVDPNKRISYPTVVKHAIKNKLKFETLSEEMRILYVAFTRAKEKLIITASVRDLEKSCIRWCSPVGHKENKLLEYEVLSGRSYIDWICLALSRHKDFKTLREIAGCLSSGAFIEDESSWSLKLWNFSDLKPAADEAKSSVSNIVKDIEKLKDKGLTTIYSKTITDRLNWAYPYRELSLIPAKMTVTELKRRLNEQLDDVNSKNMFFTPRLIKRPVFMEDTSELTSAEKGTILHFVMQHLDFCNALNKENIKRQLESMVEKQLLTEKEVKAVDSSKILDFIHSQLGTRLRTSSSVKRELPFTMELPVAELTNILGKEINNNENLLLQGVIDCFFEETDGLVLIDYKTDYVSINGKEAIREKYRVQMEYYKAALEKLSGKKVKESYIYLFWNGDTIAY